VRWFAVALAGCHAAPLQCPRDTVIVVDTDRHRMGLCESGKLVRELPVALGEGGVGKHREGDRRTPRGSYPLGEPRPSAKFHVFVPIGYPTTDQRALGMSGTDIGIHGPSRKRKWLGSWSSWTDWTYGCIALATDDAIDGVVDWIEAYHPRGIEIE
jgi:murein L,D-transpeptidase YafK